MPEHRRDQALSAGQGEANPGVGWSWRPGPRTPRWGCARSGAGAVPGRSSTGSWAAGAHALSRSSHFSHVSAPLPAFQPELTAHCPVSGYRGTKTCLTSQDDLKLQELHLYEEGGGKTPCPHMAGGPQGSAFLQDALAQSLTCTTATSSIAARLHHSPAQRNHKELSRYSPEQGLTT